MRKEIVDSIELEEEEENKFKLISLIWDRTPLRAGRRIRIAFLVLSLQQMMGSCLPSHFIVVSSNHLLTCQRDLHRNKPLCLLQYNNLQSSRTYSLSLPDPRGSNEHRLRHRHNPYTLANRALGPQTHHAMVRRRPLNLYDRFRHPHRCPEPRCQYAMGKCGHSLRLQLPNGIWLDGRAVDIWT